MAMLQRVLAGLCASRNLVLYSVDVSDAYLQVPQVRPTFIVTDDGEAMQLLYSLPGSEISSTSVVLVPEARGGGGQRANVQRSPGSLL